MSEEQKSVTEDDIPTARALLAASKVGCMSEEYVQYFTRNLIEKLGAAALRGEYSVELVVSYLMHDKIRSERSVDLYTEYAIKVLSKKGYECKVKVSREDKSVAWLTIKWGLNNLVGALSLT